MQFVQYFQTAMQSVWQAVCVSTLQYAAGHDLADEVASKTHLARLVEI
jgi:hypothetical protein